VLAIKGREAAAAIKGSAINEAALEASGGAGGSRASTERSARKSCQYTCYSGPPICTLPLAPSLETVAASAS
jgi:hypothetical protein